jgi:hypothetical protein
MKRYTLLLPFVTILLNCSHPVGIAGTSNDTETVVGEVTNSNNNPVNNANVTLHDQKAIGKIVTGLSKTATGIRSGSTLTDMSGCFRFDSVDTGVYYLEINSHDSLGGLLEINVRRTNVADSVLHIIDTVKRMGTIEGKIDVGLVSKTVTTYVYIAEVQKLVPVDTNGNFTCVYLPPYDYTLRVMQGSTVVSSPLDTAKVMVKEGDTTYVGNAAPIVLIGVSPLLGAAPVHDTIIYNVRDPDGDPVVMYLNFGDGMIDTLSQASGIRYHVYVGSGTYVIKLTAGDGKGGFGKDSAIIAVAPDTIGSLPWTKEGYDQRASSYVPVASLQQNAAAFTVGKTLSPGSPSWSNNIFSGDVNGDGRDDLVWIDSMNEVCTALSGSLDSVRRFTLPYKPALGLLYDLNSDRVMKIGVGCYLVSTDVRFYSYDGSMLWQYTQSGAADGISVPAAVFGGKLYCAITSGSSLQPRGIWTVDLASRILNWRFSTGTDPGGTPSFSIDTARQIMTLSGFTPNNGATGTGLNGTGPSTDDGQLWHIALNAITGTAGFCHTVNGGTIDGTLTQTVDFNGNIIAFEAKDPTVYPGPTRAWLLDSAGDTIRSVNLATNDGRNQNSTMAFSPSLIVFNLSTTGEIKAYDHNLGYLWTASPGTGSNIIGIDDIDGDGSEEVIVINPTTVYIYGAAGQVKLQLSAGTGLWSGIITDVNGDKKHDIVVAGTGGVYVISTAPVN